MYIYIGLQLTPGRYHPDKRNVLDYRYFICDKFWHLTVCLISGIL